MKIKNKLFENDKNEICKSLLYLLLNRRSRFQILISYIRKKPQEFSWFIQTINLIDRTLFIGSINFVNRNVTKIMLTIKQNMKHLTLCNCDFYYTG